METKFAETTPDYMKEDESMVYGEHSQLYATTKPEPEYGVTYEEAEVPAEEVLPVADIDEDYLINESIRQTAIIAEAIRKLFIEFGYAPQHEIKISNNEGGSGKTVFTVVSGRVKNGWTQYRLQVEFVKYDHLISMVYMDNELMTTCEFWYCENGWEAEDGITVNPEYAEHIVPTQYCIILQSNVEEALATN